MGKGRSDLAGNQGKPGACQRAVRQAGRQAAAWGGSGLVGRQVANVHGNPRLAQSRGRAGGPVPDATSEGWLLAPVPPEEGEAQLG